MRNDKLPSPKTNSADLISYYQFIEEFRTKLVNAEMIPDVRIILKKTKEFIEKNQTKKNPEKIDLNDKNNPLNKLLETLNVLPNGTLIIPNVLPLIISSLELLAKEDFLIGQLPFDSSAVLFQLIKKCLVPKNLLDTGKAGYIISGLATLAKANILIEKMALSESYFYVDFLKIFKKSDNHKFSLYLMGLSDLFTYGILEPEQTDKVFNKKLITLIDQFQFSSANCPQLSSFLHRISRLCYFLGPTFYKDEMLQTKLQQAISFLENNISYQTAFKEAEQIQLCEAFFYFIHNPDIKINNPFLEKFHEKLFSSLKKSTSNVSTKTHEKIFKVLRDNFKQFNVEKEVFTECGFHVDLLVTVIQTGEQFAIECDGEGKNETKLKLREALLNQNGFKVILHITNKEWHESQNQISLLKEKLSDFLPKNMPKETIAPQIKTKDSYYRVLGELGELENTWEFVETKETKKSLTTEKSQQSAAPAPQEKDTEEKEPVNYCLLS